MISNKKDRAIYLMFGGITAMLGVIILMLGMNYKQHWVPTPKLELSNWEPVRLTDVSKTPYQLVGMPNNSFPVGKRGWVAGATGARKNTWEKAMQRSYRFSSLVRRGYPMPLNSQQFINQIEIEEANIELVMDELEQIVKELNQIAYDSSGKISMMKHIQVYGV